MFEDRLVNTEDKEWFQELLRKHMSSDFQVDPTKVLGSGPLLYGDFMLANTDNKLYEEITDVDKVCILHAALKIHVLLIFININGYRWTKCWMNTWRITTRSTLLK